MIYIDPPYNTGTDFIYHDTFKQSVGEYEDELGIYNEDEYRLFKNADTNGRFHSDWCSMIYSRLMLAKNLLTDDGVIFISISDDEKDTLTKICDEVFGERNFIATLIWDKNHSAQAGIYKVYHEYVLLYAKEVNLIETPQSLDNDLFEAGAMKKASGRHSTQPFTFPAGTRFDAPDNTEYSGEWGGVEKVALVGGRMRAKNGKLVEDATIEAAYTQISQMQQYFYGDKENLVDSRGQKIVEFYLNSSGKVKVVKERGVEAPQTTCRFGAQGPVSVELAKLFGTEDAPFDSPKPLSMIMDFVGRFTNEGDIVCDFFAGSSTTAHGIMELNASSGLKRHYILIQIQENLDESLKNASKDGKKTLETAINYLEQRNLPHLLTEIGKERIRLVIKNMTEKYQAAQFDGGFRVFKVDNSNMKDVYYAAGDYNQNILDMIESNIKEDRTELDLLFSCILEWGMPLSLPYVEEVIDGVKIHNVADGDLIACFEENINEDVVKKIASREQKPLRVVFRDSSFTNSPAKINVEEIFKLLSPNTKIKVL